MYQIVCTRDLADEAGSHARRAVIASGFRDRSDAIATAQRWVERHHPSAIYRKGAWYLQQLGLFVKIDPSACDAAAGRVHEEGRSLPALPQTGDAPGAPVEHDGGQLASKPVKGHLRRETILGNSR